MTTLASSADIARSASRFVHFAEQHRNFLNDLVRQYPNLLQGSFKIILSMPKLLDFDNKRAYFRAQMQALRERDHWGGIRIKVHRNAIFEESYNQLHHRTADEMRGRISVTFYGEEGIDAGGLLREWYTHF